MRDKIARWYAQGLWSRGMVLNAVKKKILTEDEAAEILGGKKPEVNPPAGPTGLPTRLAGRRSSA